MPSETGLNEILLAKLDSYIDAKRSYMAAIRGSSNTTEINPLVSVANKLGSELRYELAASLTRFNNIVDLRIAERA
jgi:hypothetical protein